MTKKKKIIIATTIIISLIIVGTVYAKYVAKIEGEGTAEIANWSFKVNGQTSELQEINLASTYDNNNLIGNKLAPGATGSFDITIDGSDSDVGINYEVNFQELTTKPKNLKFVYNGTFYDSLADMQNAITGFIGAKDTNKVVRIPINWIWGYETGENPSEIKQNNIQDTKDSQNINEYKFKVSVLGSQSKPTS